MGNPSMEQDSKRRPTQDEIDEESRRGRRLRILVHLALSTIADGELSVEEAAGVVAATRKVALNLFPGKEIAFDIIYRPKFQRLMNVVYRLQ
jgi:hypothetical protein